MTSSSSFPSTPSGWKINMFFFFPKEDLKKDNEGKVCLQRASRAEQRESERTKLHRRRHVTPACKVVFCVDGFCCWFFFLPLFVLLGLKDTQTFCVLHRPGVCLRVYPLWTMKTLHPDNHFLNPSAGERHRRTKTQR